MKLFGLIGYPLGHSFSKKYFTDKFKELGIADSHEYELFETPDIKLFPELIKNLTPHLKGLNVTIPYKQSVIPFLNSLDESAQKVGAVNVIKISPDGQTVGYNSDYHGFKTSIDQWLDVDRSQLKALILGNGGAAKAVQVALTDLGIEWKTVSRKAKEGEFSYGDLDEGIFQNYKLIVNTSPVGTFPKVTDCPKIPYQLLDNDHWLYDLVYNPAETLFMKKGLEKGAKVMNGIPMLTGQAERAWEIWNKG
jgi:shikimate dehydrogenase